MTKSCKKECFLSLKREKESLRKGHEICYVSLETQSYLLSSSGVSLENMRRIYQLRTREIHLKENFPSAYPDTECLFPGCTEKDSQRHIFESSCFSESSELGILNTQYNESETEIFTLIMQRVSQGSKKENSSNSWDPKGERKTLKK